MLFPCLVADLSFAPVHFERSVALGALVILLAHRVSNRHGEQLAAVGAVDFRFAGNGTGKADLVYQEIVKQVHGVCHFRVRRVSFHSTVRAGGGGELKGDLPVWPRIVKPDRILSGMAV